jgi:hypothetical protein
MEPAVHELGKKFGTLVNSVDRNIEQLSALCALRPQGNGIPQLESLIVIDDEVTELENRVAELRLFIRSEQNALRDIENLLESSSQHSTTVSDC